MGDNLGMAHKLAVNFVTSLCMTLYMQFLNDVLAIWKPGHQEIQEQEGEEKEEEEGEGGEEEEGEEEIETDYIVVGPINKDIHNDTGALLARVNLACMVSWE